MDSIRYCGFYPPLHSSSILYLRVWILSDTVDSIYHSIRRAYCTCGYGFYPILWILSTAPFVEHIVPAGMDSIQNCGFYPLLHSSGILYLRVWILSNTVDSIHCSIRRAYCTCGYGFYPTLWILSTAPFVDHIMPAGKDSIQQLHPLLHSSSAASFR
jgi:hypothetical protein